MPNTIAPSEQFVRDFQQNVGFLNPKVALHSELIAYQEGVGVQLNFVRDTMKLNTEAIVKLQDKAEKWAGLEAKVDRMGEKLDETLRQMREEKLEAMKEKARQDEKKAKAKKEFKAFQEDVLGKLTALTGEVADIKRTSDHHTVQLAQLARTTTSTNIIAQAIASAVGVSGKTLAQAVGFLVTKTMEAYQAYVHGIPLPDEFQGQGPAPEAAQLLAVQDPNALAN